MSYYRILQVSESATDEEIKKAYQELIRKVHPDKSSDENREKFLLVDSAYKVLRDPVQRKIYDSEQFQKSSAHLIIHDTVTKNDFLYDKDENIYSYQCKCGSLFLYNFDEESNCDEDDDEIILSCDECSLNILIKC